MVRWLRKKALLKIEKEITSYLRIRFTRIDVTPMRGVFNYRCYWNAVQYVYDHGCPDHLRVVEVVYVDQGGEPCLHYIVENIKENKYHEVSVGYLCNTYTYYLLRVIHKDEWDRIDSTFSNCLDYWLYNYTTWWQRFFLNIDRVL